MPEITATDAARRFSDLLDAVEQQGQNFTVTRHGKAIAQIEPVHRRRGADIKAFLRSNRPDESWAEELRTLRRLLEVDRR